MFRRSCAFVLAFSSLLAVGCGDDGDDKGPDGSVPDAAPGEPDAFVPPEDSYTLTWGPVTVPPGEEDTKCVTVRLKNVPRIHVGKIHNVLNGGSHHLIVYRTNDEVETTTPEDCDPFVDTLDPEKGSPLMVTQKHDETLQLPEGVAFTLQPNQMIRLEMHYVNASDAPVDISATTTFYPLATFEHEADFLFIGTPDIVIPANSEKTVGPRYFEMPNEFADVNFFALTGHTHQYGLNVHVATAANESDPGTPLYDHPDWLWNEPETSYFDPTFKIPAGGGFRFSCDYRNTSNRTVEFGESTGDEMCFFWAYYYPSKGSRVCVQSQDIIGRIDACCPGDTAICNLIDGYLRGDN